MSPSGDRERWVDFRAIKEAVGLEAVLEHYEVKNLRRRRRDQLEGCCPLHGGERQDAFQANLSKNVFHCFACDAGPRGFQWASGPGHSPPGFRRSCCR